MGFQEVEDRERNNLSHVSERYVLEFSENAASGEWTSEMINQNLGRWSRRPKIQPCEEATTEDRQLQHRLLQPPVAVPRGPQKQWL